MPGNARLLPGAGPKSSERSITVFKRVLSWFEIIEP